MGSSFLQRWLGLDLRSLGLMRVGVGLVILYNLFERSFALRAHYTPEGVLPLAPKLWGFLDFFGSYASTLAVFVVGIAAALALTLGYKARLAGWVCWLVLMSLANRNPLVMNQGDTYLAAILFWCNLLPWDRHFSLPGRRDSDDQGTAPFGFASLGYILQVCFLYWFSALPRTDPSWQIDFDAAYLTLQLEPKTHGLVHLIASLPTEFLQFATASTLWLESIGPFLLLIPSPHLRGLTILLFAGFHLSLALVLKLGIFHWVCIVALLGLLPTALWQGLLRPSLDKEPGSPASSSSETSEKRGFKIVYDLVAAAALFLMLLSSANLHFGWSVPEQIPTLAQTIGLNQRWSMFSPGVPKVYGWHSIEAQLSSGRVLDLVTQLPYPSGRYFRAKSLFDNARWQNYYDNLQAERYGPLALPYLRYVVAQWNLKHPEDPVTSASLIWHARFIEPDFQLNREERNRMVRYGR